MLLHLASRRFPELDVSAVDAAATLENTAEIVQSVCFAPLEEYGISRGRFRVILYLSMEEMVGNEPPGPSGIAEGLGVTRATMTQLLDGLERDGILERRPAGHDRRAQAIHLTDEGRNLFDRLVPPLGRKTVDAFAPLDADERQTLVGLLQKLAAQEAQPLRGQSLTEP